MTKVYGRSVSPYSLTIAKPTSDWTWDKAIESAGLNLNEHRAKKDKWTVNEIIEVIKELEKENLALNRRAVMHGDDSYKKVIERVVGYAASPFTLVGAKPEENWSWDLALVKSGINPNEVRLKGSAPFKVLSKIMQQELRSTYAAFENTGSAFEPSGNDVSVRVAVELKTSENLVIENETRQAIYSKVNSLSDREQELFNLVLEYYEETEDLELQRIESWISDRKIHLESGEIKELFDKIKKDEELLQVLLY